MIKDQTFKNNFLTTVQAKQLADQNGTPLFVISRDVLSNQVRQMLSVPAPYGLAVRYAMKANPQPDILKLFQTKELKIDASSGYEVDLAIAAGYKGSDILLTSQQLPHNLKELVEKGVQYNATSLHQLEEYGKIFFGGDVSVRINPGVGSGHSAKTNVGGVSSSFGIWHEYIPRVIELAKKYNLNIIRLHTHIGSGSDPKIWQNTIRVSIGLIKHFSSATILNLGGGFKVGRMDGETGADMGEIGERLADELKNFQQDTGRKLQLELEPGSFLVVNAGILIASVDDVVDTGTNGYHFLKLNTGMNDILRPSLYGAQHPIASLSTASETQDYVIVGHNCESGDLLSPAPGQPEASAVRTLPGTNIGDLILIGGTGAYCAAMSAHGYNSFPNAQEVVID